MAGTGEGEGKINAITYKYMSRHYVVYEVRVVVVVLQSHNSKQCEL